MTATANTTTICVYTSPGSAIRAGGIEPGYHSLNVDLRTWMQAEREYLADHVAESWQVNPEWAGTRPHFVAYDPKCSPVAVVDVCPPTPERLRQIVALRLAEASSNGPTLRQWCESEIGSGDYTRIVRAHRIIELEQNEMTTAWRADVAEALGAVNPDDSPHDLSAADILERIRDMRDELADMRALLKEARAGGNGLARADQIALDGRRDGAADDKCRRLEAARVIYTGQDLAAYEAGWESAVFGSQEAT